MHFFLKQYHSMKKIRLIGMLYTSPGFPYNFLTFGGVIRTYRIYGMAVKLKAKPKPTQSD